MAGPIRLRRATDRWSEDRVRRSLLAPLEDRFGARSVAPRFDPPPKYAGRRLEMNNGDLALFLWAEDDDGAYWVGNTETPEPLWRTEKYTFSEVPYPVSRWTHRELLSTLAEEEPWLAAFDYVSWFFLPVLFSKDGRHTTRAFFRDHASGFPDADRDEGLSFYEQLLRTGTLDEYRYEMAAKLGTSQRSDLVRMRATMGEFNAAKLLQDAGHTFAPEVELDSGHALDFRVDGETLVEVTRPQPPGDRRAGTPAAAVRETVDGKTSDQLRAHQGAVLLVDCTSFPDDRWKELAAERPDIGYRPTVVYRYRPDGRLAGYAQGSIPLSITDLL
ncbi:MAG: DUF5784 family protein [Salinirussus sp.]